jgi:hypothetical protein
MKIRTDLSVDDERLAAFRRHGIQRLALGGHEVELRTNEDLSPLFRDRVQAAAVPLYATA